MEFLWFHSASSYFTRRHGFVSGATERVSTETIERALPCHR